MEYFHKFGISVESMSSVNAVPCHSRIEHGRGELQLHARRQGEDWRRSYSGAARGEGVRELLHLFVTNTTLLLFQLLQCTIQKLHTLHEQRQFRLDVLDGQLARLRNIPRCSHSHSVHHLRVHRLLRPHHRRRRRRRDGRRHRLRGLRGLRGLSRLSGLRRLVGNGSRGVGSEDLGDAGLQRLRLTRHTHAYHQNGVAVLSLSPLLVGERRDARVGGRVHIRLVALELARHDEGQRLHVALAGQLHDARHLALVHIARLLRQHAQTLPVKRPSSAYTCRHGGGVLRQRVQRGVHHLVVADVAVALARQVQHVRVHVEEGQQRATRLRLTKRHRNDHIQRVVRNGLGEVLQVPQLPLSLGRAVEAGGDDVRAVAQPRHLGALGAFVGLPLAHHGALARVEDAVHFVLRGDADERAVVVPVQVLREGFAIEGVELFLGAKIPNLSSAVASA